MKLSLRIFLPPVVVLLSGQAYAFFDFNNNCKNAYTEIFNLRFAQAEVYIDKEKKLNPSNTIILYLENYRTFLQAFISEENNDYLNLKEMRELSAKKFDAENHASPWYRLCRAETEMFLSFIRIKNSEFFSGAVELRRAYKLFEENHKLFPDFKPNLKALGVMHAFIGAVPENYKWLLKVAGMYGTIKQGISELTDLYYTASVPNSDFHFMFEEIQLILSFSKLHLEKNDDDVKKYFDKINPKEGIMQVFALSNYYYNTGHGDKVLETIAIRKTLTNDYPMHYLTFLKGLATLNKGDDSLAAECFTSYIQNFKGGSFIKASCQKLAWIYLMKSDTSGYNIYIAKCKTKGSNFNDEDKQALKEAESGTMPNAILLRARLYTDGGYYRDALQTLAGHRPENYPTFRDKIELTYRLGRVYDKSGAKDKALIQYAATLKIGKDKPYYFAAASALYMGLINENKNDFIEAEKCYRQCLAMRNHEYQNSIDQKAKAGLNRIGKKTIE